MRLYSLVKSVARFWRRLRWTTFVTVASLAGCVFPGASPATIGATDIPSGDWQELAPGLEQRIYRPGGNYNLTSFVALRIDPSRYTFRAHYRPGAPLDLNGWRRVIPDAVAYINANFFDREARILGLLVSDGVAYGQAYNDRGGLLQVQNGDVRVRSTIAEPYYGEPLEQAVQAFPMLVADGAASFFNTRGDRVSRRTVVGQDTNGRIVLLVTSSLIGMTLTDLSAYLPTTDLGLLSAVNLDGGGSTLMALELPGASPMRIFSFDSVPAVLAVYPR